MATALTLTREGVARDGDRSRPGIPGRRRSDACGSVARGVLVSMLYAAEQQVVHHVTLVQSLALETGQRPELGTRRETAVRPGCSRSRGAR